MAKSKTQPVGDDIQLDQDPALLTDEVAPAGPANPTGDPVSTKAGDFDLQAIAKGGAEQSVGQLDLSEEDEDDNLDSLFSKIPAKKWVMAKFTGANGSPFAEHVQSVQGRKAKFPLNKWVVVPYYYILAARTSGYVDFVHNKGGKHMRKVDNKPTIQVQDAVPDDMQDWAGIQKFVATVAKERGKKILIAVESI